MEKLEWLHISDLHRGSTSGEIRWPSVRDSVLNFLKEEVKNGYAPAFVVLTGDLTFSGTEYEAATIAVEEISSIIGHEIPWFVVPGNHDLRRSNAGSLYKNSAKRYFCDDDDAMRLAVKNGEREVVESVGKLFSGFDQWYGGIRRSWPADSVKFVPGLLSGDFLASLDCGPFKVGIAGLNSSFLDIGDSFAAEGLAVEPEQLVFAADDLKRWSDCHHFTILMMHHPPSMLGRRCVDDFWSQIYVRGGFSALLHGHVHVPRLSAESFSNSETRVVVQAQSFFGLEKYGREGESRSFGFFRGGVTISEDGANLDFSVKPYHVVSRQGGGMRVCPSQSVDEMTWAVAPLVPFER